VGVVAAGVGGAQQTGGVPAGGADQTLQTSTATPNPPKSTKPKLPLEIARESLTKLLRTRKLGLMVTLDEGAKLTLTGKGKLKRRRNGHNQAGKSKARAKLRFGPGRRTAHLAHR
jgi:hypothetical protein